MKRKHLWGLAAAALVLILLLAGLFTFSRLVYGRSMAATLFTRQFSKEAYTTEEDFQAYLEAKRAVNAEPYALPYEGWRSDAPERREYGGLSCYILNEASAENGLILYFAGGSYIDAPREVHWQFLDALAGDTGAAIVVPLYPLLPDGNASAAYGAIKDFYLELSADMSWGELVFMGDSAGGGLALSFAMQLRDMGVSGPDRMLLLSPWVDVTLSNPEIPAYEKKDPALDAEQLRHLGVLWAGDLNPADPVVSPLYGDLEGLCPIALFSGTGELLYPDIALLAERLEEAGLLTEHVVRTAMFHVWPLYKDYGIPEAEEDYRAIAAFMAG